jgi:hypothetical protein
MTAERLRQVPPLVLLILFWFLYLSHASLGRTKRSDLGSTRRPFVLNGLHLALDRSVTPALDRQGRDGRLLVIVSSDTCKYTQSEIRPWQSLLRSVPFKPSDMVVVVTFDGDHIPGQLIPILDQRHIEYQILHVTNSVGFIETTGIAYTPGLLALDTGLTLRLAPIRATHDAIGMIIDFFASPTR